MTLQVLILHLYAQADVYLSIGFSVLKLALESRKMDDGSLRRDRRTQWDGGLLRQCRADLLRVV
jgi:hypothetical protein